MDLDAVVVHVALRLKAHSAGRRSSRSGKSTASSIYDTSLRIGASLGLQPCLASLRGRWEEARALGLARARGRPPKGGRPNETP
jgi:hypothetical protein